MLISNLYIPFPYMECMLIRSGARGKEPTCRCRRHKRGGFDPWVGKIPWEEGMATHSHVLAWRIPWTEELVGSCPKGCKELDLTEAT